MGIQNGQFSQHKCHGIVSGLIIMSFFLCIALKCAMGTRFSGKTCALISGFQSADTCYALEPLNSFSPKTSRTLSKMRSAGRFLHDINQKLSILIISWISDGRFLSFYGISSVFCLNICLKFFERFQK